MVWAKLDDAILDNAKIAKVGVFGFAMHVAAITWCCRNLTDGFVPMARVTALLTLQNVNIDMANPLALIGGPSSMSGQTGLDPFVVADALLDAGLWDLAEGGYQIHDFLVYNPSKEEVLSTRAKNSERVSKYRKAAKGNSVSNAVGNTVGNGAITPLPVPVPVPINNPTDCIGKNLPSAAFSAPKKPPVKHRNPETMVPAFEAPIEELHAWAAKWKIPEHDPGFQVFLDAHRKKESLWRDWSAAWRTFKANETKYGFSGDRSNRVQRGLAPHVLASMEKNDLMAELELEMRQGGSHGA